MRSIPALVLSILFLAPALRAEPDLRKSLLFHAPFDGAADASFAGGDKRLHTTPTGNPKDGKPGLHREDIKFLPDGRFGAAVRFNKKVRSRLYFTAPGNVAYSPDGWGATFSLWMRLDPDKDLAPGYSDPFQITDKKWNDASLFLDFSKDDVPRHFRLGAFSDFAHWNPKKLKFDEFPENERPLVTVRKPPFTREGWTHVVFTCEGFNKKGATSRAVLYLDGKPQGELSRSQMFTWDLEKTAIFLGIDYIGDIDDFAIFSRPLTEAEVKALYERKGGVGSLYAKTAEK